MQKLVKDGKSIKATISYSNNTYVTERTVYVDDKFNQFVKINGSFVSLDFYKTNPEYKFHGYWN